MHWDDSEGWDGEGGGREGSRWGTHVHPWQIHVNVWQNPYNIVKIIIIIKYEATTTTTKRIYPTETSDENIDRGMKMVVIV